MEIDLSQLTPDVRKLSDMQAVVYDQEWLKTAPDKDLYYMYRGLQNQGTLRYDITVVPANMLGQEFSKTKGHYHVGAYGEVYTVLEGTALYLLQKKKEGSENEIEDVVAITVKPGQTIVIPSFYGHITINPSATEDLKMANWVSSLCQSDYSLFEKLHGGCYYYTTAGWVKNPNYAFVPPLRQEQPLESIPENLDFLTVA